MAEPNIIYKITILAMLDIAETSLKTAEITDFFTEEKLTDYWEVNPVILSLLDAGLVSAKKEDSETAYAITTDGEKTFAALSDRLSSEMEKDIRNYLKRLNIRVKAECTWFADTVPARDGGFFVRLKKNEGGIDTVDLSFPVPTKDMADLICFNWKSHSDASLAALLDSLTQ